MNKLQNQIILPNSDSSQRGPKAVRRRRWRSACTIVYFDGGAVHLVVLHLHLHFSSFSLFFVCLWQFVKSLIF